MSELSNIGELTDALTTIRVQTDRMLQMAEDLKKWKVEWTVEIVPSTFEIKVTAMKPFGGGGVIKTISKEDALYYQNDPNSLADSVAEEVFDAILKDVFRKELRDKLSRALLVASKMDEKRQ